MNMKRSKIFRLHPFLSSIDSLVFNFLQWVRSNFNALLLIKFILSLKNYKFDLTRFVTVLFAKRNTPYILNINYF